MATVPMSAMGIEIMAIFRCIVSIVTWFNRQKCLLYGSLLLEVAVKVLKKRFPKAVILSLAGGVNDY